MNKIIPCFWFNNNAEEAVDFYLSIFPNSRIIEKTFYGETGPGPEGTLLTAIFELNGAEFMALNGGHDYSFNPAISFSISCKDQDEIDYYWNKLSEGGSEWNCGWVNDKFGISWQIVPEIMSKFLNSPDKEKSGRAMKAMLGMVKLDIEALKNAFEGN